MTTEMRGDPPHMRAPRVVIESPLAPSIGRTFEQNQKLARRVCRVAVMSGFNPYASHLFYTQFLDDTIPDERKAGIELGLDWSSLAEEVWFVWPLAEIFIFSQQLPYSKGMQTALRRHTLEGKHIRHFVTYDEGISLHEINLAEAKDGIQLARTQEPSLVERGAGKPINPLRSGERDKPDSAGERGVREEIEDS